MQQRTSKHHQRDVDEMEDVRGKSLLHLQCHFGMDTLSWAMLGATVTGIDFSPPAIEAARGIAAELGFEDARFIESERATRRGWSMSSSIGSTPGSER